MVTIQKLCDEIELSDKTVRTRLDYINDYLLMNNLGKIVKKPRVGVYLDASDEQKRRLDRLLEKSKSLDMVSSSTSRLSSALRYILLIDRRKVLTTQQLAHSLYLSVPTTIKVVKECKDWLALFNIQLDVVRNKGIHLEYSEVSYRLAIKHFIMRFNPEENPEQALLHFAPGLDLNYLRKQIIETEKEWNFELADESFTEVLIYLSLAVYREQKQVVKPIDIAKEEKSRLMEYNEFAFADAIFKKVQKKFSCNFLEDEIAFLSVQILCSKLIDTNFAVSSGELLKRYDDRMREFVNKIIEVVSNVLNVDMRDDEQLFNGLLMHIRPAIFRLRFERKHPN
jgi:transcriptional antiterminator